MYKIDLTTLLRLFEEFQRSGTLIAEVPKGACGLKEPGVAMVELINGKIAACSITQKNGSVLASGSRALQMLRQAETLKWQIQTPAEPEPPPITEISPSLQIAPPRQTRYLPAQFTTPLNNSGRYVSHMAVPQRRITPNQRILNSLTLKQRRVLSLVDDIRNVSKIASLLATSVEETQKILNELEAMQLIRNR